FRMSPPTKIRKADGDHPDGPNSGIIRFCVDKVSLVNEQGKYSPAVEVGGIQWNARVRKAKSNEKHRISVALKCSSNKSRLWSIDTDVEFAILNRVKGKDDSEKHSYTFCKNHPLCGRTLQNWDHLVNEKKGFIKDDKITVEVRFKIKAMRGFREIPYIDFTDPNELRHDVALIIEGKKIYVSKQYLSLHSPFFNSLFYGEFVEKDKKEIELKDVDREEFLEILNVIYPSYGTIKDENVQFLLKLGDR
ncbi:hypothetical protein PMAYCL1PPCAC_01649, partial [Pristionchus mayeri]